jgi:shikimate dehydrogenase
LHQFIRSRDKADVTHASLQQICACFGQPVAGNPTQFMMERAFAHHQLEWRYLTLEVAPEQLGDAIRGMRAMGFRGANITKPHKMAVLEHLDRLTEAAGLMGAVNCIDRAGNELVGENTDGKGFVQSLRTLAEPAGKKVVILGAGGAARAISVELALAGAAEIRIVNRSVGVPASAGRPEEQAKVRTPTSDRSPQRGEELAELLRSKLKIASEFTPWEGDFSVPEGTDVLINATSIGLFEPQARVPVNRETLVPPMVVADVVFNPPETRLLRDAAERGCKTLDGLGMLVHQGAIAFKIWTGIEPDAALMRDSLEEYFGI